MRDGLANAHADLFADIPVIAKALPDPIDQMKLFELIQIIPSPTRAALKSGDVTGYKISDPRIMGYLRNNSIFTFGKADRAKTSATIREILDAMWLFNDKFERALSCSVKSSKRSPHGAKRNAGLFCDASPRISLCSIRATSLTAACCVTCYLRPRRRAHSESSAPHPCGEREPDGDTGFRGGLTCAVAVSRRLWRGQGRLLLEPASHFLRHEVNACAGTHSIPSS